MSLSCAILGFSPSLLRLTRPARVKPRLQRYVRSSRVAARKFETAEARGVWRCGVGASGNEAVIATAPA